jgi:hypothetical protein
MFILYIDPGSGSLLFQALLSGLLTVVVFFKRIVAYIKFKFGKAEETTELEKKEEDDN